MADWVPCPRCGIGVLEEVFTLDLGLPWRWTCSHCGELFVSAIIRDRNREKAEGMRRSVAEAPGDGGAGACDPLQSREGDLTIL